MKQGGEGGVEEGDAVLLFCIAKGEVGVEGPIDGARGGDAATGGGDEVGDVVDGFSAAEEGGLVVSKDYVFVIDTF